MSQIKPGLGQGRADLRHKIKMPACPQISKCIAKVSKNPQQQSKIPVPKSSKILDKIIPDYAIPHISSGDDLGSRMVG